ncbi:MAG: acetate--CoA ligase family protein [Dehalococcoidia bacterium]
MEKSLTLLKDLQTTEKIIFNLEELHNFFISLGFKVGKPQNNPTELTLGLQKDFLFGYVIFFGFGQQAIDIWDDCSYRIPPLKKKDAKEMVAQPVASKILLNQYKNLTPPNVEILYKAIDVLSELSTKQLCIEKLLLEEIYTDNNNLYINNASLELIS